MSGRRRLSGGMVEVRKLNRKLLLHCTEEAEHVVIVENGQVVEYRLLQKDEEHVAGAVYKGKVKKVLPRLQAAFIDIGLEKNAFLPTGNVQPLENEELIVQVLKEPVQDKGAKVSANIHIPGSYTVYLPQGGGIGVSQRILPEGERRRLKKIAARWKKDVEGVIFRTASAGAAEDILREELDKLRELWMRIVHEAQGQTAPLLLNHGSDSIIRLVQDYLNEDLNACLVDHPARYRQLRTFFHDSPFKSCIRLHEGERPLFDGKICSEIEKALQKKVWLSSGAYLLIEQTETLTVIDVNSGRFTGKRKQQAADESEDWQSGDGQAGFGEQADGEPVGHAVEPAEETFWQANEDAAKEIARQLRLRDIGGLVIIDFIGMKDEAHRQAIVRTLTEALRADRNQTVVQGFTPSGLVEITRKKTRKSLLDKLARPCPHCHGQGYVIDTASFDSR